MTRRNATLGSMCFLLLAPGVVAGVLPWWISHWQVQAPFLGLSAVRIVGAVLAVAGITAVLDSFGRFALQGLGTPAPVLPTRYLVVTGLYRYVRNPMYLGVVWVVLGQGLLFGNIRVLAYGIVVWLSVHLVVVGYEEPTLRRRFGAEYEEFRRNVPRWIPRVTAWRSGAQGERDARP